MKDNRVLTGSLCALGCEVLYGLSYLFTKQTAETASPLALLGLAVCCCAGGDEPVCGAGIHSSSVERQTAWAAAARGAVLPCLYFIGETVGIRETTVTESGVFLACVPALSLLASTVILKKKPTKRQIIGILVTFLGVMTTVVAVGLSSSLSPVGYAALMLAVVAYALYSVFVDLAADYTGAEITYVMLCSGATFYGLLALGEAAAHGALSELLTLPARSGTVSCGGALSGHRLFGCGVFPVQCGDCKNRREQNVLVYRRIHDRFHPGRRAGAG